MSKVTSVDYPTFTSGQVSLNGKPLASASMANGVLSANYNMNDYEKAIYEYAQKTLASILPQVNVFSPEVQGNMQSQLDAYRAQGEKTINSIYSPMIKNLQNDIASRFGNFDNSLFMDNLKGIESKRSDAVSSFAQDIMAKRSQLEDQELDRRYNFINLMNAMQTQPLQNALSYMNSAMGLSNSANSYNNGLYNSLYKQSLQNQNSSSMNAAQLANTLGFLANSGMFL